MDFIARERSLHTMEFRDFIPGVILSMQKRTLAFISAGAGPSILLTVGVMQFHLVPRPLPQTILIFFLAISPLISFTAVLTATIMCKVLKYLVLFPFISLCN